MADATKVRFAKIKLLGQAKTYLLNIERLLRTRRHDPIETWEEKKEKLREKYLPPSYHQHLLDRWQKLTQDGKLVAECIENFDGYLLRCGVYEDSAITLSKFKAGLNESIQRELYLRDIDTLEHVHQVARDVERFQCP